MYPFCPLRIPSFRYLASFAFLNLILQHVNTTWVFLKVAPVVEICSCSATTTYALIFTRSTPALESANISKVLENFSASPDILEMWLPYTASPYGKVVTRVNITPMRDKNEAYSCRASSSYLPFTPHYFPKSVPFTLMIYTSLPLGILISIFPLECHRS